MNRSDIIARFRMVLIRNKIAITDSELLHIASRYNWSAIEAFIEKDVEAYSKNAHSNSEMIRMRLDREEYHAQRLIELAEAIAVNAARRSRMRYDSVDYVVLSHVEAITEGMKSISCDLGYPCRK